MYKTHSCGELRPSHIGQKVTLAGWVHRRRDHGGVVFLDLRDRYGLVQITINPNLSKETLNIVDDIRFEWVLQITGTVQRRPQGMENPNMASGEIEVIANEINVLNPAKTLPFMVNNGDTNEADEATRLKYRYLDLRRERMKDNIILRHRVVKFMRDYLDKQGFIEIENSHPVQSHARRRTRLPRAVTRLSRPILCPAPVASTAKTIIDGCWHGSLFPNRALFPRRRSTRRPPARIHAT